MAVERLSASLRLVLAASVVLEETVDVRRALQRVADLAVPRHADGFVIELDDGAPPHVVSRAGVLGSAPFECELRAGDRSWGTLRASRDTRPLDAADRELFSVIAQRCASAVANVTRYQREHELAQTLQRALLPEGLPLGPSLCFDAAYLASSDETIVGGDWYDAFPLPDGRIALSIGDVAGHGLGAAIVMGEVRQAFRAAALDPKSPSLVLERANRIVNMRSNPTMVTAIFGIFEPGTATLTYACAGHPPPVLALADGVAKALPGGGIPLGILDAVDAEDWTFTVPPGGLVACYTDGLTEHTHDVVEGELRLLDELCREVVERNVRPARTLLDRVFAERKNSDDAALLLVTVEDRQPYDFYFEFSAIPLAVPLARHALRRYAERAGFDEETTFSLLTVVGEAVANAVEHGYARTIGNVCVRIFKRTTHLEATVEDHGRWRPAQQREERGRGLPLMRALSDGVEIRTDHQRTLVRMMVRIVVPGA
jgi:anti-sigma regulatory factor (Ser/Thr protein kinase)